MLFERIRDLTVPCTDDGHKFVKCERLDRIASLLDNSSYQCMADRLLTRIYSHQDFDSSKPYILISCHVDSLYGTYFAEQRDGVFTGTFDNSACNAVLVEAMLANGLPPQALIAFTGDEEEDSKGADQTIEALTDGGLRPSPQMVMVLDLTEEQFGKCSFTIENLFVSRDAEGAVLRFENKNKLGKFLQEIVGPAVILIDAEADESWQYDEHNLNCFSLCLPCKPLGPDMHHDRGVAIREDAAVAYLQVLTLLANGICQDMSNDQTNETTDARKPVVRARFPQGAPPAYAYLQDKAERYLEIGPERYRADDYFHMPRADASAELLDLIESGMEQICLGKGLSVDDPFTGLGVRGFYALLGTLHFKPQRQSLVRSNNEFMVDEMVMRHVITEQTFVLYNRVPPPVIPPEDDLEL